MTQHLILFDGVCNLCNSSVQFIIKHDSKALFSFASLQSKVSEEKLAPFGVRPNDINSVVYIHGKKIYVKSTAALKIAKNLDGPWKLLYFLIILPRPFRDLVYDYIAKNRYKWFGKHDECMLLTPQLKKRFISDDE
ncbi:thiol-disulfide oxidoreductase DCC family protein [Priestia megaterium]|nr:thiol-disulfide oxidoreductase DCC family protein [Priestia megaterium]